MAIKSPAGVCKIVTLVLGVIILGVGLDSHYQSAWVKRGDVQQIRNVKLYKICDLRKGAFPLPDVPDFKTRNCPSISLERYFVAMIIISLMLSLILFVAGLFIDLETHPLKWIDVGIHGVLAFMLLVAGIVYLVSAGEIDSFFKDDIAVPLNLANANFRKSEKLAAGSLTILQSAIYVLVALFVAKFDGFNDLLRRRRD